jgi:hypothetical protein
LGTKTAGFAGTRQFHVRRFHLGQQMHGYKEKGMKRQKAIRGGWQF